MYDVRDASFPNLNIVSISNYNCSSCVNVKNSRKSLAVFECTVSSSF